MAITNWGLENRDTCIVHRTMKAEVCHHGNHDCVFSKFVASSHVGSENCDHSITVNDLTCVINRYQAVCITVEGEPDIGSNTHHS